MFISSYSVIKQETSQRPTEITALTPGGRFETSNIQECFLNFRFVSIADRRSFTVALYELFSSIKPIVS